MSEPTTNVIRAHHSRDELDGTAYFEFQPGTYSGEHWVDGSLYVAEEAFCLLEPFIRRHHPAYDHYAFSTIGLTTWNAIIRDLEGLAHTARAAESVADLRRAGVGFHPLGADREFAQAFMANAEALAVLSSDVAEWLRAKLRGHSVVSLLGM